MGIFFKHKNSKHFMIDYHVHSTYSADGMSSPREFVHAAQELNLKEIGFAEHVDLDPDLRGFNFLDFPGYCRTLEELREPESVTIRCGLEVGYQPHLEGSIRRYVSEKDCDFIIGSIHELNGISMNQDFLTEFSPRQYFEAVKTMIMSGIFDIVGHLEYFRRWGGLYSSSEFRNEICTILQLVIEKKMVLEVNTSGLRHHCQDTYPSSSIIQWYRELGGELVSLGSDAHIAEDTAFQFSPVTEKLKSTGFDMAAIFDKRRLLSVEL